MIAIDRIVEADANPFNRQVARTAEERLCYGGTTVEIDLGSNRFIRDRLVEGDCLAGIIIDNQPLIFFRFEQGHPLLSMVAYDELNQRYLEIVDSALSFSTQVWDAQWINRRLTIRGASRKILLEVEFLPPHKIHIRRGRVRLNGVEVKIGPDFLYYSNTGAMAYGNQVIGPFEAGIAINSPRFGAAFVLGNTTRYPPPSRETQKTFRIALDEIRRQSKEEGPRWIPHIDPIKDPEWRRKFGLEV